MSYPPLVPPSHLYFCCLQRAVPVPGDARDDWKIVCALSDVLGVPLPYSTLDGVRERLVDVAPHMAEVHTVQPPLWLNGEYFKVSLSSGV